MWLHILQTFLFSLLLSTKSFSQVQAIQTTQKHNDYNGTENENTLQIHIIPHTHDDPGWLKTVDECYYGEYKNIQNSCVTCILNSLIPALQENPSRKFTYVEMSFFSKWWDEETDPAKRKVVKDLIKSKQLAFVNGGWVMHDEATTHFVGMIDQTTLGHEFLLRELDYVPTVGWQIDPFGHSKTQATLFSSKTGFNSLYFGRIDYQDLHRRWSSRDCEGLWTPDLFWGLTGSYQGNYGAPPGFCFDPLCADEPLYGSQNNVMSRVKKFLVDVKSQADKTRGRNVMLTMGSDFQYSNAFVNYKSLDLLIDTINQNEWTDVFGDEFDSVKAFYSNPEIYTEYKYKEFKAFTDDEELNKNSKGLDGRGVANLEIKNDDFFPYSDCPHCFWAGYFTSRPSLKKLERVASGFLQVSRHMHFFHNDKGDLIKDDGIQELEKAVSLVQHHDAVSGTSKQHVADDYTKQVQSGMYKASSFVYRVLKDALGKDALLDIEEIEFCQLRNESICELSSSSSSSDFYVGVYNALPRTRSDLVQIPVNSQEFEVSAMQDDGEWTIVDHSVITNSNYANIEGASKYSLWIDVKEMKPLSLSLIQVRLKEQKVTTIDPSLQNSISMTRSLRRTNTNDSYTFKNKVMEVQFRSGELSKVINYNDEGENSEIELKTEWGYYKSYVSDDSLKPQQDDGGARQNSGAYIFRPSEANADLELLSPQTFEIKESSLVTEIHSTYEQNWVHQIVRLYRDQPYFDIEYTVGPIPVSDDIGKEVIHRITSSIDNNGLFYTDSNGREFMKRKRSFRETWDLEEYEPIAGNYYPVGTSIFLQDEKDDTRTTSLSVLVDRAQGGSSLSDGSLELMVHRRTLADDARGVGEAINEKGTGDGLIISGVHRILVGNNIPGAHLARSQMDQMFLPAYPFVMRAKSAAPSFKGRETQGILNGHLSELPENVQLVTLKSLEKNKLLLRLAHAYAEKDSNELGKTVQVDISKLFRDISVTSILEKTLSGNQNLDTWNTNRMKWSNDNIDIETTTEQGNSFIVDLEPMEVRTFEIGVKYIT